MDVKKEIESLKERIDKILKEYDLASLDKKEELSKQLENLNKRLKILNMLLKDLALTKIVDDDQMIEKIYDAYLEKLKEKIDKLKEEQIELKKSIEFDKELVTQVLRYPEDIRQQLYRNINEEKMRMTLQQFMGANLNLIKEKIEYFGISPVKEFTLRLLNRANEISTINLSIQNDEMTKYALHLINMCAYSLNLESEEFIKFINQDKIVFEDNINKGNSTFIELNDKYEITYVDNNRLIEFADTILANKDKFVEFITGNKITKQIFENKDIVSNFLSKLSILKLQENYSDLIVLLRYYLVFDCYKDLMEFIDNTKVERDIKETTIIANTFNNSNSNQRNNLYHNNENRIKSLSRTLEQKKLLSLEDKRNELINLLDGTILHSIQPVESHSIRDLRNKLVNLQRELDEFNSLKDEYISTLDALSSLRVHPETDRMRYLLTQKETLNVEREEILAQLNQYKNKLQQNKENALVDGKVIDVDSTKMEIEKRKSEIEGLKEDIELIKKEIERFSKQKEELENKNSYVDANGKTKTTGLSKLFFKMSKTFKDNENDKENSLSNINITIEELTKELIKREEALALKEEELSTLCSSLNDDVVSYDEDRKELLNLFDIYNEKTTILESCLMEIEQERKNWRANRLEQLENRLMELTTLYPNKYNEIKALLSTINKEQLQDLEPELYTSLIISMEIYEKTTIPDRVLEDLSDIEITMSDIEDKYGAAKDIYDGLIKGSISPSQLETNEAKQIIMDDKKI